MFWVAGVLVAVRIAQTHLHAIIRQTENAENMLDQFNGRAHFLLDLVRRAKEMGIILAKAPHASHSAEFPRLLVAIDHPELGEANRQIAVTARLGGVNLNVVRTIHRLEQILLVAFAFDGRILAVLIVRKMAGDLVELHMPDVRRENRGITALEQFLLHQVAQLGADDSALRHPKNKARTDQRRNGEQPHLFADLAMVPFAGFFLRLEPFIELSFVPEGSPVNALELRIFFVAPVVS